MKNYNSTGPYDKPVYVKENIYVQLTDSRFRKLLDLMKLMLIGLGTVILLLTILLFVG